MTERNKTSEVILDGGNIEFADIAALAIATAIFISQGDDKVLETIGQMADSLKGGFIPNEETADEQQDD